MTEIIDPEKGLVKHGKGVDDNEDELVVVDDNETSADGSLASTTDEKERVNYQEIQQPPVVPHPPPPNGGTRAWIQVAAGFFLYVNSWGVVNAFGVFQTYYEQSLLVGTSPSSISWVGSIQGFLVINGAIVTGRLFDAGYLRELLIGGAFLLSFGLMMTSLSTQLWQLVLAQGICCGMGCSCAFCPSVAVVSSYFTTRRALAIGLMASGASLGGVIYPIMVRELIPKIGFPWTARVLGFVILGTMIFPILALKSRLPPRRSGSPIHLESLKDGPFLFLSFGAMMGFAGMYIPLFFIQSYAINQGVDENLSFYMLAILNAGSFAGRILPNLVADKLGSFNLMAPICWGSVILAFCWFAASSASGLVVFSVFYGLITGAIVSLPPSCIVSITPDMRVLGVRLGMGFFLAGFGILIGPPAAGAIIHRQDGKYTGAQILCGIALTLAAVLITISRFWIAKGKLLVKV